MCLPEFGYEDLLLHLATDCNIKICLRKLRHFLLKLQKKLNENIVKNANEAKLIVLTSKEINVEQIKR